MKLGSELGERHPFCARCDCNVNLHLMGWTDDHRISVGPCMNCDCEQFKRDAKVPT